MENLTCVLVLFMRKDSNLFSALTLAASLGVCSTYIAFVGQTLASLSADSVSNNIVNAIAPNVDETTWELITAATVYVSR